MQHLWIWASIAAAFFQALRYATLKELNRNLSALVTTYVRMLFGLPFLMAHLAGVLAWTGTPLPASPWRVGLASALCASVSYLTLREAIVSLDPALPPAIRAASAGVGMTLVSFVLVGLWLAVTSFAELARIRHWPGLCLLAGLASAAGTICWFLAAALTNVSYVAAVVQVQIVFALAFSRWWFKESLRPLELAGIALILAGVLMFRFA